MPPSQGRSGAEQAYPELVRSRVVLLALVVLPSGLAPGCATAIAAALGASGSSARAAADLDSAMLGAAMRSLTSGGQASPPARARPDATSFGGEPTFVCEIPEDEPQRLAASSLEGAVATCAAMNALPEGGVCVCREAELGSTLGGPVAER